MATIKLQSSEVLENAEQGFIGLIPFKCWSRDGSESFLKTILEHNASPAAYHNLGPGTERNSRLEKGTKHSAKTRRRIAKASRMQTGRGKQEKQYNVPQSVPAANAMSQRVAKAGRAKKGTGKQEQEFNVRQARGYVGPSEKRMPMVLNSGHGRPSKLHVVTYGKNVSARDKARRDVVKAARVRMG